MLPTWGSCNCNGRTTILLLELISQLLLVWEHVCVAARCDSADRAT